MRRFLFPVAVLTILMFTSCSGDDNITTQEVITEVITPATYTFERNGESTVNYSGQTTRIEMANEMVSAFTNFEKTTEALLLNMFTNKNNPFSNSNLNESDKNIKSKIAASFDYFSANTTESAEIKNEFESWISGQINEVFANKDKAASEGKAGQIADGEKTRYVSGKGLEYNQMFAKSLLGALLADQMLNNYLSTGVLDAGDNRANNNAGITEEGKAYTTMEHKWDEAYGYLFGDASVPQADPISEGSSYEDGLLFRYLFRVDGDDNFAGIAQETFDAFKKGRAAIVAKAYDVRDEQIAIIKKNISTVFAVRTIHYLQGGKVALAENNMGSAFHELSEGLGFLYSIRFSQNPDTNQPYLSAEVVNGYVNDLTKENGFWDVSAEKLDEISQAIANAYGLKVADID